MAQKKVFFEDVDVGYDMPKLVNEPIDEVQLVKYAGASGDFNSIHIVHNFAVQSGFDGVIGHGMLSMGFAGQFVTDWAGAGSVKKISVQFRAISKPRDVVTVEGKVVKKYTNDDGQNLVDCEFVANTQKGDKLVVGGATVELPVKN